MKLVDRKADLELGIDSKAMLAKANKEKKTIRYRDRVKCEIIKDTRFYDKAQIINPHPLVAEELISKGIAKKVK